MGEFFNYMYEHKNGVKVPMIALGTALNDNDEEVQRTILDALDVGYRSIDTAQAYQNQKSIGKALKKAPVKREEIYITSKVWNNNHGYDKTMADFDNTLKDLQLDYMDQFLIHWPGQTESFIDTWKALEQLYREKRVQVIGVSNFLVHHLERLMEVAEIMPMVNQIELNPIFVPKEEIAFCQANGIQLEAQRPLYEGKIEAEILKSLGEKYNKTPYQIVLRWHLEQNIRPLPKTVRKARMIENISVFDFHLEPEEIEAISALNTGIRGSGQHPDTYFQLDCNF